jgi:hypothetical protein
MCVANVVERLSRRPAVVLGRRLTDALIPRRADEDQADGDRTDDDLPAAGPGHGREPTPGGWALAELVGDASVRAANGNMPMT